MEQLKQVVRKVVRVRDDGVPQGRLGETQGYVRHVAILRKVSPHNLDWNFLWDVLRHQLACPSGRCI